MIYSINGTLKHLDEDFAVVECCGIGFRCHITNFTANKLPQIGSTVTLYTYLNVREDALTLFGFADINELNCFKMLISVSGVGPKVALSVLSSLTSEQVALCVVSGDSKSLTVAPGVGMKLAQRMVLELKDKIPTGVYNEQIASVSKSIQGLPDNVEQAINALVVLGYSQSQSAVAVSRLDSSLPVQELIKKALVEINKAGV